MNNNNILISVVIATFNREEVLRKTLRTVFEQTFPHEKFEVIVVVDGSSDGTTEMLRKLSPRCFFRVLVQENKGAAAARNYGTKVALGDLILVLDDDIMCAPNLIEQHCRAHKQFSRLLVRGPIFVAPESPNTLARHVTASDSQSLHNCLIQKLILDLPRHADLICNSSIPRSVFEEIGGFDEAMPFQRDDCEFGLRLWKKGVQFRYEPNALAYQMFAKRSVDFAISDAVQCGSGEVLLCAKHPEYRPYSALAGFGGGHLVSRVFLKIALNKAFPVSILARLIVISERFERRLAIKRMGIKLLRLTRRLMVLRSAVREAGSFDALMRLYGMKLPVLLYHNISPANLATTEPSLTIDPKQFAKQMRWLKKNGYTAIAPSIWRDWCRTGRGLPAKPVILTFDDAYAGVAQHALPILESCGFTAAVFVVTGQVGGNNEWERAIGRLGGDLLMSEEQIKFWANRGIEFGAHSRTHRDLTRVSGPDLDWEVQGSSADLGHILDASVVSFAYPFGNYDGQVVGRVSQHFDLAFTCDEGLNGLASDPCLLRRSMVRPGDVLIDFACRVWFGWSPVTLIRSYLRIRSRVKNVVTLFSPTSCK